MTTQKNALDGIKAWLFPGLVSVLGTLLWIQYNGISEDIKETKESVQRIEKERISDTKDIEFLRAKIGEHEKWLDDIDSQIRTIQK